jgi:hypothetical protein
MCANHPQAPEEALLRKVTEQLEKVDPNASTAKMRKYGTLGIIGRFVHLQIEEKEDWQGKRVKKGSLIFPRYHQWDLVRSMFRRFFF